MDKSGQFYLNNPNLPNEYWKGEYTPEMVSHFKKAKDDIIFFAKNFFYILNLDRGRECIKLYDAQKRILQNLRKNRFFILMASRQIGKTTCMSIYTLWQACFNKDQRILIVANKEQTAIEIFQRVRMAYEELPNWLKPAVKKGGWGKTSMELANGSRIGITTTTGTAARGQSCNILLIDEMAFIECVTGETKITIRHKKTGNIIETTVEESQKILQNG